MATAPTKYRQPSGVFLWKFPGCPIRIELPIALVERLSQQLPSGAEPDTGGVLLGPPKRGRNGAISIVDYAPLPLLAGDNQPGVAEQTAVLAKGFSKKEESLAVIGYYRTRRGEPICLKHDDLSIIQSLFADPWNVFLIINPSAPQGATAGFFFWEGGGVFSGFSFMEFPFDAGALASTVSAAARPHSDDQQTSNDLALEPVVGPEIAESQLTESAEALAIVPRSAAVAPDVRAHPRSLNFRPWALAGSLALALVAIAALLIFRHGTASWRAPVSFDSSSALGLEVHSSGNEFRITWNGSAQSVLAAQHARLSIKEGTHELQSIDLEAQTLRSGSLVYSPTSRVGRLTFQLEVTGSDDIKSVDSAIVVSAAGEVAVRDSPVKPEVRPSARGSGSSLDGEAGRLRLASAQLTPRTRSREQLAYTPQYHIFVAPTPARASQAPKTGSIASPPSMVPVWQASPLRAELQNTPKMPGIPSASPAPIPIDKLMRIIDLTQITSPSPSQSPASAQVHGDALQFVAPVLLRQNPVELPPSMRALPLQGVRIKVQLHIDEHGKVKGGRLLSDGDALSTYLGEAVLRSAEKWQFSPARLRGRAIPSDTIVDFNFAQGVR